MTAERMAALGLTTDPSETGVLHDALTVVCGVTLYLTAVELKRVLRREQHRNRTVTAEDVVIVPGEAFRLPGSKTPKTKGAA